ncbi:hypothetical protein G8770_05500 [Aestuariicella hydrocarbonica]|uniref:Uncharacterized protein n=2 Tax=Pseudomaricurvus hydrocarbonicus TaxID=1470433 RepID=A0A9E5JUV1_9GAMM|nr:hypothetical protein [Aestuariicella hydrocarbonica]
MGISAGASADGNSIDKVYDPYVNQLEKELEYRVLYQDDNDDERDGAQRHILGAGLSWSDNLFTELYLIGKKTPAEDFEISAVEAEVKIQLTEQGEYSRDWGVLFELEAERDEHIREASTTLIVLQEWSRWVGTANLSLGYEWGNDIDNEWETAFAGQLRYRYRAALEPALELYWGESSQGLGPVISGSQRLGGRRQLMWELGVILGLDDETPDRNWKLTLEYEF